MQLSPKPFVDRATVETLLRVGRRRAQQIIAPCVTDWVGSNGLADRDQLVAHLQALASSEDSLYEVRRQKRVASFVQEQRLGPRVLIEAPTQVFNQSWSSLPPGIELGPGFILTRFATPEEGLQKLLALAMAIGNDFSSFEQLVSAEDPVSS